MSTTCVAAPISRVRFGLGRADITPPVGIYQGLWGAAKHERSTGIHRPLTAEVMVFESVDGAAQPMLRGQLDQSMLAQSQFQDMRQVLSDASGIPCERVEVTISHTHAAGRFLPDRYGLPGGDLIAPYLKELNARLRQACIAALADRREVLFTYAVGRCNMAANRDYWDEAKGRRVCGYNPDAPADDTVVAARVTDMGGDRMATLVHYACHPTTLAHLNSLISPDYLGALREQVERATGAPCVFIQGACGDLGPRDGQGGDVLAADRNGRQVAYGVLGALESLGPPATDFAYQGPLISGATLGIWAHVPADEEHMRRAGRFGGEARSLAIPIKPKPDRAALEADVAHWQERQRDALAHGDADDARDAGAFAERARRLLLRLAGFPDDNTYALRYSVYRLGDAMWITTGGEPYNLLQLELRRRFPDFVILVSPLGGDPQASYILPVDRYGKGLYQEEASILGPGGMEMLIEAISARITDLSIC